MGVDSISRMIGSLLATPLPGIGQDFMTDSPLATPTLAIQREPIPRPGAARRRRAPRSDAGRSLLRCGLLLYTPYIACCAARPTPTCSLHIVVTHGAFCYIPCSVVSRTSARPGATRVGAYCGAVYCYTRPT